MRYHVDIKEDVFEALVSEKITFSDLEGFREMIQKMMESKASQNIMDLSDVEFIDSAGLGMLLLARDEISKSDMNLILRSPKGQVKRMFSVARFDQMFEIEDDI